MIWIGKRDLGFSMNESFHDFQTLHERMVLIAHFVFPRAESAARINVIRFKRGQNFRERLVAIQTRCWITVLSAVTPGRKNFVAVQKLRVTQTVDRLLHKRLMIDRFVL